MAHGSFDYAELKRAFETPDIGMSSAIIATARSFVKWMLKLKK